MAKKGKMKNYEVHLRRKNENNTCRIRMIAGYTAREAGEAAHALHPNLVVKRTKLFGEKILTERQINHAVEKKRAIQEREDAAFEKEQEQLEVEQDKEREKLRAK